MKNLLVRTVAGVAIAAAFAVPSLTATPAKAAGPISCTMAWINMQIECWDDDGHDVLCMFATVDYERC